MALTRATDKIIGNAAGNLNLSGIITASSFVGSGSGLTGVASTDNINTSTPATFGTIDATGISTFREGFKVGPLTSIGATHYTDGGIRSVGIITASSFSGSWTGSTGSFTGDVTIDGNLGVGGTITYEDVARVDATGISTFREGFGVGPLSGIALTAYKDGSIRTSGIVTAGDFKAPDGNTNGFYAGNSDDLHLFHNGASTHLENDTGDLTFTNKNNNNIIFKTTSSETERLRIASTGYVGVGEASPATILHVKANVGDLLRLDRNNTGAVGNQIAFRHSNSGTLTETGGINCVSTANAATGELRFYTKASGASNAEKLRIGSAGQLGIGGANYGSSGQVLTSGGSGAAFSWATPSGGITHIDQYRLTSSFTGDGTLQTNLEQCDTKMQGSLGAAMSYNGTGDWTFPTTGFWRIDTQMMFECPTNVQQRYCYTYVHATTNNSSYSSIMETYVRFAQVSTNISWATAYGSVYVDITDVGNQKVRIKADVEDGNSKVYGHADLDMTAVRFTRMADT